MLRVGLLGSCTNSSYIEDISRSVKRGKEAGR